MSSIIILSVLNSFIIFFLIITIFRVIIILTIVKIFVINFFSNYLDLKNQIDANNIPNKGLIYYDAEEKMKTNEVAK